MTTTEVYPSRVSEQPRIAERQDPAVHGPEEGGAGPLSPEDVRFYARNGYLMRPALFSQDEVAWLRGQLEALMQGVTGSDTPEVIRESGGDVVRSIFAIHREGSPLASLVRDERLAGAARQVLGGPVYIHQSRVNFKPGFNGKDFYWHSDFETWHVEDGMPRMRAVSFSVLLDDNLVFNGPLMVFPGSHHHYIACVGRTPNEHYRRSLRRQEYGVPDQESLRWLYERYGIAVPTGPAGSVLMFECNTMHGSTGNISPLPRRNVFLVFNSTENALREPFGGTPPRPEFVASREIRPV